MKQYDGVLITFGCSWTQGVGVGYYDGMSTDFYNYTLKDPKFTEVYTFRSLLSKKYNLKNINFAAGGFSNQSMFRFARDYFISDSFKTLQEEYGQNIYVLWGTTSVYRNEFYNKETKRYSKVKYDNKCNSKICRSYVLECFDFDNEVEQLQDNMKMWNMLFEGMNIKNIWYDTFNHYRYTCKSDLKLLSQHDSGRDIMTKMSDNFETIKTSKFHFSSWRNDDPRVSILLKHKLVNPISYHPTKKGHEMITEILTPEIERMILD